MPKLPRGKKLVKTCPVCGNDFNCYTCDYSRRKYCSVKCKYVGTKTKIKIECLVCGKEREVFISDKTAKYCSKKCEGKNRRIDPKDQILNNIIKFGSCWIWQNQTNPKGYGIANLKGKTILAHRLSYIIFNGSIPKRKYICHRCDTPSCVNPEHLFIGTPQENTDDMIKKKRNHLKISKAEIDRMRYLYENFDYTKMDIARMFGHCKTHTGNILRGIVRNVY